MEGVAGYIEPRPVEGAARGAWVCAGWLMAAAVAALLMLGAWWQGFYSPATWVLAVLLGVAGVALAVAARWSRSAWWGPVAAVGAVMASQLAGTGAVATKHWGTYFGYTGLSEHLFALKVLAGLTAGLSAVATVVVARRLAAWGCLPAPVGPAARWTALVAAGVLLVALPVWIGSGSPDDHDVTSLLAYALIYSLPWAAAVVATAWATRPVALAALAAVATSILVTAAARPMVALVLGDTPRQPFAFAMLLVIAVAIVRSLARRA